MRISISYFDQVLAKRESQSQGYSILRVFIFAILWLRNFVVKIFAGTKLCENGRKLQNCEINTREI